MGDQASAMREGGYSPEIKLERQQRHSQATSNTIPRSSDYMLRVLFRRITSAHLPRGSCSIVASTKMEQGQLFRCSERERQ